MIDFSLIQQVIDQLHWREPLWLLLVLQPLLIWSLSFYRHRSKLSNYADRSLQPWVVVREQRPWRTRLFSRYSVYFMAILLLAISAAGPRLALHTSQANADNYMDIMVVMDVSRSMLSNDVMPNRLRRAELEINELLTHAQGQRIGVIVYAARAHLYTPLTWDYSALSYYLNMLDKLVLPTRGSQVIDALTLAKNELADSKKLKAIVLISDGDIDKNTADFSNLTKKLITHDIPIYVLGIGSSEGGAIPLANGGWLSHENKPVISRMDETLLNNLAQMTGGRYSRATDDDSDWQSLYGKGMSSKFEKSDNNDERLWLELFPWVLLPAIALFFIACMPKRLYRSKLNLAGAKTKTSTKVITASVILASVTFNNDVYAEILSQKKIKNLAYQAYSQQDYQGAEKYYGDLTGFSGRFGEGASNYRNGDYVNAQRNFSHAVLEAENDHQRASALFNLGNSYFKQGDYKTAIMTFRDVLRYQDTHLATQKNLSLSQVLFQQVSKIYDEQSVTERTGTGPRSATAMEDLSLNDRVSASIDETEENKKTIIPELQTNKKLWQELLRNGLQFVEIAARGESTNVVMKRQQAMAHARLYMLQLQDKPASLWKNIFELKEGFAASQIESNEIPGVQPW